MKKKNTLIAVLKNPFVLGILLAAAVVSIYKSGYHFGQWLFAIIH